MGHSEPLDLYDLPDPITEAVRRQAVNHDPSPEDLCAWGYVLSQLTALVQDVAGALRRQVVAYGDRRVLRDNEGADPAARLVNAARLLADVADAAGRANSAARLYHSAIGHIALDVDAASR